MNFNLLESNLKMNTANEIWKYDFKVLQKTTDEFKFVKQFLETCRCKNFVEMYSLKEIDIYRVTENFPRKRVQTKRNNLMLFHGTSYEGVNGILKTGYIYFIFT